MRKLKNFFLGKPKNPLAKESRQSIALVAFLAWVGLGSDGLSSANYGPEHSYLALHQYQHLALFLALATTLTVFIISLAYNQVISLFPNGGGGYKVATTLLGPYAGLVSGVTLIIDYVLTVATSIASGTEALLSILPASFQSYRLYIMFIVLLLLIYLNLRGAKESIKFLLPIFLGFFISHIVMIVVGIYLHGQDVPSMMHSVYHDTTVSAQQIGVFAVIALFMRAYSIGAGTYTGLEAVSNNVNILKEPRVKTGLWTMFYMAVSLSVIASGIILLYLLWSPTPTNGMTLNAVVFQTILGASFNGHTASILLTILMLFEAGILFVAANTGFLAGPAALSNMSVDAWMPKQFGILSSRLVKQNGVLFFGVISAIILLATDGNVTFLVILYSLTVFITFSLSILGLIVYWLQNMKEEKSVRHLLLSCVAFVICVFILISAMVSKFFDGGWETLLIIAAFVAACILIRKHYFKVEKLKADLSRTLKAAMPFATKKGLLLDAEKQTAIFFVLDQGEALHALMWVQRLFPGIYHNAVFVGHGTVDVGSYGSQEAIRRLKIKTTKSLRYLKRCAEGFGLAAETHIIYGTDPVKDFITASEELNQQYKHNVYFSSKYIYPRENWFVRFLHSDYIAMVQQKLQMQGSKMLLLPLKL